MTGVKRLAALLVLIALAGGAWLVMRPPPASHLLISDARVEDHSHGLVATLAIGNSGGPDRLIAVAAPGGEARIVSTAQVDSLPIPAGSSPALSEDGAYLALSGLGAVEEGQLIPLSLTFEGAGDVTAQARVMTPDPMAMHHAHSAMAPVPGDRPAPQISVTALPDGDEWVLRVETRNFTFNEDLADGPHVPGVGHAHLYIDGLKLKRLYHRDARIGALPKGRYRVRVTLNTNDHRVYIKDGVPISASVEIEAQ